MSSASAVRLSPSAQKQKLKLELLRRSRLKLESLPVSVVVHEHLVRAGCMFFGTATRRTLTRLHRQVAEADREPNRVSCWLKEVEAERGAAEAVVEKSSRPIERVDVAEDSWKEVEGEQDRTPGCDVGSRQMSRSIVAYYYYYCYMFYKDYQIVPRVHKNKSMQHHTLGSGTAEFQAT